MIQEYLLQPRQLLPDIRLIRLFHAKTVGSSTSFHDSLLHHTFISFKISVIRSTASLVFSQFILFARVQYKNSPIILEDLSGRITRHLIHRVHFHFQRPPAHVEIHVPGSKLVKDIKSATVKPIHNFLVIIMISLGKRIPRFHALGGRQMFRIVTTRPQPHEQHYKKQSISFHNLIFSIITLDSVLNPYSDS